MFRRLYDFLEQDNILFSHQIGFCANHSINHALISLTGSVNHTLDNNINNNNNIFRQVCLFSW